MILQTLLGSVQCLDKKKLIKDVSLEPENVSVTFPSERCGDSVLIGWDPPAKEFLIESYRVTCEAIDLTDRVVELVGADLEEVVVGPLKQDSTYTCFVTSRSKIHGTSKPVPSKPFSTLRSVALYFPNLEPLFNRCSCILQFNARILRVFSIHFACGVVQNETEKLYKICNCQLVLLAVVPHRPETWLLRFPLSHRRA